MSYEYIRRMSTDSPVFENAYGTVFGGIDMLPKPAAGRLPLLITGRSQQSLEWIAEHGDGWMTYPRPAAHQQSMIEDLRSRNARTGTFDKPVMEPLYVDLLADPDATPTPIHLGLRLGVNGLCDYLLTRQGIGVNHVALNLRFNHADIDDTLERLSTALLPEFST